jgi:hypothetical protein
MDMQKLSGLIWPSLVVMLTGVYAYWATQGELVSSRPRSLGKYDVPDPVPTPGMETLHARLWQDPLSISYEDWKRRGFNSPWQGSSAESDNPVNLLSCLDGPRLAERARRTAAGLREGKEEAPKSPESPGGLDDQSSMRLAFLRHLVDQSSIETICMPVFVPGGPYAEDKESRMRIRYAVVTAMAESGYVLKYSRQMSYVTVRVSVRVLRGWEECEIVVPIKLYRKQNASNQVLVLWINESQLGLRPLLATHRILNQFFGDVSDTEKLSVRIVGPASSDTLDLIASEMRNVYGAAERIRIMDAVQRVAGLAEPSDAAPASPPRRMHRRAEQIHEAMQPVTALLCEQTGSGTASKLSDCTKRAIQKSASRIVAVAAELKSEASDGNNSSRLKSIGEQADAIRRWLAIDHVCRTAEDLKRACLELRQLPGKDNREQIDAATRILDRRIERLQFLADLRNSALRIERQAGSLSQRLEDNSMVSDSDIGATAGQVIDLGQSLRDAQDLLARRGSGAAGMLSAEAMERLSRHRQRVDSLQGRLVSSSGWLNETERRGQRQRLQLVADWARDLVPAELLQGHFDEVLKEVVHLEKMVDVTEGGNAGRPRAAVGGADIPREYVRFIVNNVKPDTAGRLSEYLDHWYLAAYDRKKDQWRPFGGFSPLWAPAQAGYPQPCCDAKADENTRARSLRKPAGNAVLFSPRATADIKLERGNPICPDFVKVYRVVGKDEQLARALREELRARGHRPYRHSHGNVILITEHDTKYGQRIEQTFNRVFQAAPRTFREAFANRPSPVVAFRMLRGVDGRLPGDSSEEPSERKHGGESGYGSSLPRTSSVKRAPEGRSQYDYLQRLRTRIEEFRCEGNGPVAAIGVVGSDVYDKLLVLRAIRAHFPHCLIFTTDMDAIYTDSHEARYTRNLLIASHFGLRLNNELQRETPPFRDSYQTATYLATRLVTCDRPEADEAHEAGCDDDVPLGTSGAERGVFDWTCWAAEANLEPVLHVVDRERFQPLPIVAAAGSTKPRALAAQVHPVARATPGNWFILLTGIGGALGILAGVGVAYRDWWRDSPLLSRSNTRNRRATAEDQQRLAIWRPRIARTLGALIGLGGVLFLATCVAGYLGAEEGGLLGTNHSWARNAIYTAIGIVAVLGVARLVDRQLGTLELIASEDSAFGVLVWESFQLAHLRQPLLLALALAQAGVVFVCGFTSLATLVSSLSALVVIAAMWWLTPAGVSDHPDPLEPQGWFGRLVLASDCRPAARIALAFCVGALALSAAAQWLGHGLPPAWMPVSTARTWIGRVGDGLAVAYGFGMVGFLLASLLYARIWCQELARARPRQASEHAASLRIRLLEGADLDRFRVLGQLTSVPASLTAGLMALVLLLVLANHPIISPTPMPVGLLVLSSGMFVVFAAVTLLNRYDFHHRRQHLLDELEDEIDNLREEICNAEGKDDWQAGGEESGGLALLLPGNPRGDETTAGVDRDGTATAVAAEEPPPGSDRLRRDLERLKLRKEQLSKISTGVFLPWNQAPYSWILGGSASLALVDLWIRWWTINV